jgi:hypothetical protein
LVAAVIGHAVQLAPAAADAPASAAWTVAADAPFSAAELQRAVAARNDGPEGLACATVEVHQQGLQTLLVCGERSRAVDLTDRRGADAARAAAVVLLELAAGSAPLQLSSPPSPADSAVNPKLLPARRWDVRGRVVGILAFGVADTDVVQHGASVGLEAGPPRWRASLDAAYDRSRHNRTEPEPNVTRVVGRLAILRELGPWRLGATATLAYTEVSRTASYRGTLWAAGIVGQHHIEIVPGHWLVAEATFDVFRHRVRVLFGERSLSSTPRLQVELGVGYQWRFGGG